MLHIENVSKQFNDVNALNNVSFDVPTGQIIGLIGQNGAGKSTTFHSILNFIKYDGKITLDNQPIDQNKLEVIGYLPEERGLLTDLTIKEQVIYFAELKGCSKKNILKVLPDWMEKFEVKGNLKTKIKNLSKGNQQKVQLICTLIHKPKFIILDEPFSGLDPVNADLLMQAIFEAKADGASIIFSSHNMANFEEVCDNLVMLKNGRVVLNGTIEEVKGQFKKDHIYVKTPMDIEQLNNLKHIIHVSKISSNRYLLKIDDENAGREIFNQISHGEYLEEFSQQAPSLDDIFRREVLNHE
ncbi:ATP-binding cassette domain-containing protein [Lactobacillus sp. S2-2]|uniref:ABC transporter ATP-binding protein n=1 Tax=Lactobacillus sp. S2-2 TaxID=2692917 RepID=UPI001F026FB6|nr:ATP-binding cassette domain-containing protein [Lactobacillus sp. S2-2]MCF6514633.1 ATP-binding cassette domain-containing protein [Lactobacillus sp. S2-2]